jgi:glycerol-3-phosphate dehydrogenase
MASSSPFLPVCPHSSPSQILSLQPTGLVVASHDVALASRIAGLLGADSRVRVWVQRDVVGVEVGGALKNIYAIGAGIVEGSGMGYNPTAMVVTRGCHEIKLLACALGARAETLAGLSGIGDLMLTCFGPASRNRSVGVRVRIRMRRGRGVFLLTF